MGTGKNFKDETFFNNVYVPHNSAINGRREKKNTVPDVEFRLESTGGTGFLRRAVLGGAIASAVEYVLVLMPSNSRWYWFYRRSTRFFSTIGSM